jgi:hypothetical protein
VTSSLSGRFPPTRRAAARSIGDLCNAVAVLGRASGLLHALLHTSNVGRLAAGADRILSDLFESVATGAYGWLHTAA